ncbi:hypothetical protein BIU82_02780 [Arthrobacter sp. SW1]|nr:hypothetical protein BIU82_02780 [Arthrobacter sp. SW1]
MILVVTVALWIVWVAPYVLRNRRRQLVPAAGVPMDDEATAEPRLYAVTAAAAVQQEKAMETMQSTAPAQGTGTGAAGHRDAAVREPAFKLRYGRCALALAGLVLLLTAVVTGALRLFSLVPSWIPVFSLFGAAGAVLVLRRLAVRDRRARMEAAFRSAMAPARPEPAATAPAEPRATAVFDAEDHGREAPRLTAVELREAALKVAEAAGDTAAPGRGGSWQPVEVPKPVYVEAAKASRPAPEPLDLPAEPKPVGKPILKNAGAAPALPAAQTPFGRAQAGAVKHNALGNLDDVLQRRRA